MSGGGKSTDDMQTVSINGESKSDFTMEDMMKSQDNQIFNGSSVDPFAKETKSIDNLIAETQEDTTKGFYDNEESDLIAELQSEYDNQDDEEPRTKSSRHSSSSYTQEKVKVVYRDRPEPKEEPKPKSDEIELDDFEFTISDDSDSDNSGTLRNDVPAVIDENYKGAKENQIIRIRTTKDCIISGAFIPENTIIEGVTRFGDRRVFIDIEGIDLGNSFVTCSMEVRDRLKRKGLETKANLSKELKKDASEDIADGGNAKISTPIGSFGVDAFKKKNREPSINLYENHKLYLRLKTR